MRDAGIQGFRIVPSVLLNLVGLPSPYESAGFKNAFPINGPFWSLFFEFWVANLIYALFWRRLKGVMLGVLISVGAVLLVGAELSLHSLRFGFSWETWWVGLARVGFSFFVGVALARYHECSASKLRVPAWALLAALCGLLVLPVHGVVAAVAELSIVFFAFPAIVYLGASAQERHQPSCR